MPPQGPLSIEANNRDVGFIRFGQPAKIKIETFNFTRYGLIDGVITSVSHDVVTQPKADPSAKAQDGADDDSSLPGSQPQYVARGVDGAKLDDHGERPRPAPCQNAR